MDTRWGGMKSMELPKIDGPDKNAVAIALNLLPPPCTRYNHPTLPENQGN